ncbi:hypothetical protein AB3329_07160 [Streptococcus sp. H31]|uniref:hypothetical protein n=1 Tax=Streptococcus huangxiaojuni TaxID=3237239 RepID=UPI0034A5C1AB
MVLPAGQHALSKENMQTRFITTNIRQLGRVRTDKSASINPLLQAQSFGLLAGALGLRGWYGFSVLFPSRCGIYLKEKD